MLTNLVFIYLLTATNEFVALECVIADSPDYNVYWQNPIKPEPQPWDYSVFPGTGIEVSQVQMTSLGNELKLPAVPHTCNNVPVDPQFSIEFDYSTVEVVYSSDPQGVLIPMATTYCLIKSVNGF